MEAAKKLASYTLGQADILRRAMGKKIKTEMDAQRENFIQGSLKNKIDKNLSSQIFDLIARFAGYGFNKSHAAAYALIAYQTAWFKTNHPKILQKFLLQYSIETMKDLFNLKSLMKLM